MLHKRLTPAFSMLELIFVIVILGIVASIGSELIVRVYEQYIVQRAEHRATIKTELAATQIANRLASAIPGTVYRIRTNDNYEPIDSDFPGTTGDDYKGLRWTGSDTDSFSATATPGWSGFCDIDASLTPNILTPGSDFSTTSTIIGYLSAGTLPSSSPAVYFPYDPTPYPVNNPTAGNTLTFTGTLPNRISEHYKLAWTSYALVVTNGDLYLHYNLSPIPGIDGTAVGGSSSLLMKNISTFRFKGAGRTIRFKICREERISKDVNITSCKEKAVF